MKLFDVVQLIINLPDENLSIGMVGTIIHVFTKPSLAYEVEFCDDEGHTVSQVLLTSDQFCILK